VRIYAFHCGGDRGPRAIYDPFDANPGDIVYGPYFFFLVEHPRGRVLFDSGVHPKWVEAADADEGAFVLEVTEADLVVNRLATLELAPEDVGHVVASHLHFDHAGGLKFFPEARVYVNKNEPPFAYWPAVFQREFYDRDDFDHALNWVAVDGEYDIFGDGRVVIVPTPGHTPGHQSLVVELASGTHVLAGDASYWSTKMRERRLPAIVWSPEAMVRSWEKLEELERLRDAKLIFTHDIDFEEAKPLAPEKWYE
jgi:glyoxylase-like metal-dependent hydrolase (beta-lactamase superfamily II)